MSSTKEKRIMLLITWLKEGRKINAGRTSREMQGHYSQGSDMACSPKTISRNIDEIRKRYKLKIPFDKKNGTYYLTEEDRYIALEHQLARINTDELIASILGTRILEVLFPGDIASDAENAVSTIINSREDVEQLNPNSFVIIKDNTDTVSEEIFTPLFASWRSAMCVAITLKDDNDPFIFEPHILAMHHNDFFTKGYNYERGVIIINLKDIETVDEKDSSFVRDNELIEKSQGTDFFKDLV